MSCKGEGDECSHVPFFLEKRFFYYYFLNLFVDGAHNVKQ